MLLFSTQLLGSLSDEFKELLNLCQDYFFFLAVLIALDRLWGHALQKKDTNLFGQEDFWPYEDDYILGIKHVLLGFGLTEAQWQAICDQAERSADHFLELKEKMKSQKPT